MPQRSRIALIFAFVFVFFASAPRGSAAEPSEPNLVWIAEAFALLPSAVGEGYFTS